NKTGDDTYLSQVIQLVSDAENTKSKAQGFADIAAKWLFYVAVVAGIITIAYWSTTGDFEFALERMVTVLIIACPHALGLAMPLVTSRSTSIAAQKGLLIRNRIPLTDLRSEEHTSELQSRFDLVCRLLLEKKKINLYV